MSEASYKYRAFISYSRSDATVVTKLYRRLERYRVPKKLRQANAVRLGRFFLDKEELSASSELGATLEEKLKEAENLIVCCSPAAAGSRWVNQETEFFVSARSRHAVLAVILDGEPHAVFPEVLRGDEPLAADFRKHRDGEEIGFLKLVAGLMNIDLGELRDLQAKMERAQARTRTLLVLLFAFLAVGASVAATIAYRENLRAQAMTVEAVGIGAGVVAKTEEMSLRFGVPSSAVEELLRFAEQRFERLFAEGVVGVELERQRMALLVDFSRHYGRTGDVIRQKDNAERALAFFEQLPVNEQRTIDYVEIHAAMGDAAWALGNESLAIEHQMLAIEAARKMLRDIPKGQLARNRLAGALERLGHIHMAAGHPDLALPIFTDEIPLLRYVLDENPEDDLANANFIIALNWRGSAEALTGNAEKSVATFDDAIARARTWLNARPDSLATRGALGSALMKRGQALKDLGQTEAGRESLVASVAAARELLLADPRDAGARRDVAIRLELLAAIEIDKGSLDTAAPYVTESIPLWRQLITIDPRNYQLRVSFAKSLSLAAAVASDREDFVTAQTLLAENVENYRALTSVDVSNANAELLAGFAMTLERLGDVSASLREIETMLTAYAEAEVLRRRLVSLQPGHKGASVNLARTLHALGLTRKFANDLQGAESALMEAATLRRSFQDDAGTAFAAADSYQQLALVQAGRDGAASKASLETARDILNGLVAAHPDNAGYAESLRRTEGALALFPD